MIVITKEDSRGVGIAGKKHWVTLGLLTLWSCLANLGEEQCLKRITIICIGKNVWSFKIYDVFVEIDLVF